MSCNYCTGEKNLIDHSDKLSLKGDFYPGIELGISSNELYVVAAPDTYEPGYLEDSVKINFCPMCGEKLNECIEPTHKSWVDICNGHQNAAIIKLAEDIAETLKKHRQRHVR